MLVVLAGSTKARTGREIARLAGRSQPATQAVLDRLVEHGLVLREEAGKSRLYRLNQDHLAAAGIASLAHIRPALLHHLGETVDQWSVRAINVSVFGSAARGDGDTSSDVDIFLVRPQTVRDDDERWRGQVDDLADSVRRWTGNHAGILEVARANWRGSPSIDRRSSPSSRRTRSES